MNRDKEQPTRCPPRTDGPQAQRDALSGPAPLENATVIAADMAISGNLRGAGNVLVEGTVIGKIKLNGTVTVARSGVVRGPIQADSVFVAGSVEGNITAKKYLRLEMTGSITGDITVSSFTIEDGGYFSGRSRMTKSGEEPVIEY